MTKILKKIFTSFVILSFLNSITFAQSISNNALPTNPTISSGSANISQTTNKLTVNQNTDKLITNWSSFNIGKDATVQFVQPSSTSSALNRVTSSDPSYIFGTLQANGKIILVNPNGVLFANGAKVDVGSIIASTLKTADKDFLSDQLIFEKDNLAGTIQNDGTIRAFAGGTVALIGSQVTNNGKIKTKQGTTALLSGDKVTLTLNGNRLIKYNIDEGTLNSLVENNNAIIAKEGVVILSAKALNLLSKSSVNNTGNIEAKGFSQVGGKIYLDGDQTTNSGRLVASSKNNSGGLIQVTGEEVKLTSTASLDASGATGGGTILVGGSFQNSDPTVRQSRKTIIEGGSILNASAKKDGDGGTIVAWSDINNPNSVTSVQGTFLATGGLNSGNGGNIETSGHYLSTDSISVNASGLGKSGTWLLDPYNVTIGSSNSGTAYSSGSTFIPSATSTIKASDIETSLNSGTSVTITTGSSGSDSGDITISNSNPISKTSGDPATLTLKAARNITIGTSSAITSTSGAGALGITLSSANSGTGGVQINSNLTSNGGNILIGGPLDNTLSASFNGIDYAKNYVGGSNATASGIYVNAVTISSGAGNIVLNGQNLTSNITSGQPRADNPSGVYIAPNATITSTTGNILSKSKTAGQNNFALSIDSTSSSLTTINSSGGGYIKLDTISFNPADTNPGAAIGLTTNGLKDKIKFSSLPTVAGLLILVNGSTQPILFTAASNSACTGTITNCGYLEGPGSNSSFKYAIYGSSTSATLATYVNVNLNSGVNNTSQTPNTGSGTKVYDGSFTATGFTSGSFTKDTAVTWPTGFDADYIVGTNQPQAPYIFKTSSENVGTYSSLTDYMSNGTTTPATFTDSSKNVYAIGWTYINPSYTITKAPLTVTANNQTTTYGTVISTGSGSTNFTSSGLKNSETIGSVTLATTQSATTAAGTTGTITPSLATGGTFSIGNYTPTYANGTVTINQAPLGITVSGIYSGSTTLSPSSFTTTGLVNSETISTLTSATLNSKNVADNTTNYVSAIAINSGTANASNYQITQARNASSGTTQNTVSLSAAPLTVTGTTAPSKTYDGTNTATVTGGSLSGTKGSDSITLTQAGTYSSVDAGSNISITMNDSVSGTGVSTNYSLTQPTVTGTINKAPLGITVSGIYSGSTTLSPSSFTTTGLVNSETISTLTSATLNSKNVADNTTNYVSAIAINSGTANASNYQITQARNASSGTTQNTVSLSAAPLTVTGTTAPSKTYDGTNTATVTGGSLSGTKGSDSITLTQAGTYSSVDAGSNISITMNDSVSGTGVSTNYSLTQPTVTGTINKAPLGITVSGIYSGSTTLSPSSFTTTGLVNSETISTLTSATLNSKNVADNTTNYVSAIAINSGTANASNYQITQARNASSGTTQNTATITAKALTASISDSSSTYGSSVSPGTLTLTGIVGSDSVSGSAVSIVSPSYSTSNNLKAGTYNQSVSSTLSGTDAGNYSLTGGFTTGTNNYTVNAKPLSVSGLTADNKVYDGTTDATITGTASFSGTVGTDVLSVNSSSVTGTFADKNVGNSKAINLSGVTLTGTDSNNYTVSGVAGVSANITAKSLTTTLTGTASKEYDANTTATLSGSNYNVATGISGETISVTKTTGTYNNKNVGTSKTVTATLASGDYSISGTGALLSNYTLTTGDITGGIGTITAKTVGLSASKTYDGSTSLTDYVTLTTGITGEALTYTGATSNNSHVATASKYISAITLADGTGGLASNYQLPTLNNSNAPVTITAKSLTISGITASDKDYDGTTTATVSTSGVVYSGKVSGDSVTVSATGTFQSASAGRGKTVNLTSTYSGTDVSNYNITGQSTTTANINSVGDSDNSNSSNSNSSNSNSNSSKVRCELTDCNKDKLSNGEIVIVRKNTFTSDNVKVTPASIKPEVETRKDQAAPSLIKIIVLKPGQEPKVDKEYEVSIRGNDAILKEQTDIIDKTITNPGKSIGSARFSIENDKGKILEYNMVVRESGLEIRPLSFDALLFADKNKATVAGAAMIDVANNLKLPVDGIKTILFDLIIDKVFEDAMFNQKDSNRNIFNINYY